MKMMLLARRTAKEIVRDPLNLAFGLAFPLVLLLLMTAIQSNIPVALYTLDKLTPGVSAFGLTFLAMFTAVLVAKDRVSSLLQRLYTAPLSPLDFIAGYGLPVLPMGLAQGAVCYAAAMLLGLSWSAHILSALAGLLLVSLLYVGIGLLCGSVMSDKQAGPFCGAVLTNVSGWLSGVWFDLEVIGGVFRDIAYALPFVHAVELEKALLAGNYSACLPHLGWVLGYTAAIWIAAAAIFLRQMKRQ